MLAFSVAFLCFLLASLIFSLASSIFSFNPAGLDVDPVDGVADPGPASHSSSMVAAPELTDLKQYSRLSVAPSLTYHCQ